jgi:Lar family restriction alleviation protein
MSKQEKDLKSCPYCGAVGYGDEVKRLRLTSTSNGHFAIICSCGATGPIRDSEQRAIEAWNTRGHCACDLSQQPFHSSIGKEEVGIKGNLKSLGLATILQMLSSENKTGVLQFVQGNRIRSIYIRNGKIVAASGREGLRLGQILYGKGMISQEQLQEALEKARETDKRVGEVLLDLGYIEEDGLKELIRYQIREAVLDISLWVEGDFEYRDCLLEFDERGVEDVSTMAIILEAAARRDEWANA